MKYKQWDVAPPCPESRAHFEQSGFTPLLSAVLSARGIQTKEEATRLLTPELGPLPSPERLKDMDQAVERIHLALQRKEQIAVYGDYDVDGITSTCLLCQYLTHLGGRVITYIPDRLEEGYGLNFEAIDFLTSQQVTLIITVDCGITAVEEVAYATEHGIDVVITDHHACKEVLPPAVAVVDPHRPDCTYPFKGLAGVGVALKLALALTPKEERPQVFSSLCDLAAVGTIADVMPMTGENRTIVQAGLSQLNPPHRIGFSSLIQYAGLDARAINAISVGYTLAPRINASGRMGQAQLALELLLTQNPERADALASALCDLNRERQTIETNIFSQCVAQLDQTPQNYAVVLSDSNWHQGVVGIVASRLAEKYSCPAFMICLEHGLGKGSCRSFGGINLFHLLQSCSHLLESFGGHALAAGFTVLEENIPALTAALQASVAQLSEGQELSSVLTVDAIVHPEELTQEGVLSLDCLEPCGVGNPRPVLVLNGVYIQSMTQVGRGRHLKLRLDAHGTNLDAIFFSADSTELGLSVGGRVDVAFYPQINEFRGLRTVQLQVIDVRPALSRAKLEQSIYDKYHQGIPLTPEEAETLLPERQEFIDLWRWLKQQTCTTNIIEDTPIHIAHSVCRYTGGRREIPIHTMLCLDVMEERGLISIIHLADRVQIQVHPVQNKVDLDASYILVNLRRTANLCAT